MTTTSLLQPRFKQLKTLRAMAIGLAISFAAPAFADNLPDVQRLIKQGQYPQALEKVDAYLSSRPKDAQGRFLKGLIYTEMNKPADAIGVFTKLSEDYPELPEPYNNLAVLYAQQKQYDKARTALEMAIRTHPSYAIAYENLGDVYAKLASQAYDKALQLDSTGRRQARRHGRRAERNRRRLDTGCSLGHPSSCCQTCRSRHCRPGTGCRTGPGADPCTSQDCYR